MRKTRLIFTATVLIPLVIGTGAGCKTGEKLNPPKIPTITPENVTAIMVPDENNLWIIGNYGIIFHSSDAGTKWVSQNSGIKTLLTDGLFIDNKNGWVVGIDGTIIHTADEGNNWISESSGTSDDLRNVYFIDANNGWAVGYRGPESSILHTNNGGAHWVPQNRETSERLFSVRFTNIVPQPQRTNGAAAMAGWKEKPNGRKGSGRLRG